MATAWQSLEEAAITLGVSSRTLHRRINKGEVETRLVNGRREVLVTVAEPVAPDAGASGHAETMETQTVELPVEEVSDDGVSQTMLMLHEDRIRRTDLAIMAYQQSVTVSAAEARRNRIGQRIAWSVAGGLTVGLFLSVIWATHRLTATQAQVDSLNQQLQSLSATTDTARQQTDLLRREAEFARLSAARAEGELSANRQRLKEQAEAMEKSRQQSAKHPAGVMDRLLNALSR